MAETNYPPLVFPEPILAERARRFGGGGKIIIPDTTRQAIRLMPQFKRLQEAMEQQRIALQGNPVGLQPEQVLVLETIGTIENFVKAVKRVEGLEWLREYELDDISPDHGFENKGNSDNPLNGQLFLVMTDQRALKELHSLFEEWQKNPENTFPRGLAPLKTAFKYLHTIRPWNAEDRIRETGVLDDWQERLQYGQGEVPFEAELWFREDASRREQAESHLREIIASMGGEVIQRCIIPDISYHAILGRLHRTQIQDIINQSNTFQDVRLLQCEGIMYLRPVGQCATLVSEDTTDTVSPPEEQQPELPKGDPIVALFDGLPLAEHQVFSDRLIVDDPDGYENTYLAHERMHGTHMASLISRGDLNEQCSAIKHPLYSRPIMQPRHDYDGQFVREAIPANVLPTDLVHRAVRRLYEPESGNPPAAPSVRIINLSVCDLARPFDREMSSWARLLDWLAWKYQVLFIVSAGNHSQNLELDIPRPDLSSLTDGEREKAILKAIAADTRNRRLLSPAETLNGLTVSATHEDASSPPERHRLIDPFVQTKLPSVLSAQGPGYRRAIKPDILLPGGRQFLTEKVGTTNSKVTLQTNSFYSPPGQRVATPGSAGQLDRTVHTRGTSNAAALASRGATFLYDLIEQLRDQPNTYLPPQYDAVLIKTLLVHGASWTEAQTTYEAALKNTENSRTFKEYLGRFLGYGVVDLPKVMACTEQRVTVLGFGELGDGEGAEFIFPLPPSLESVTEKRRLTITLAWLTPVNSSRQNYRVSHLWFNPKSTNTIAPERTNADYRATQRGTVQHEVLEGNKAVTFQDEENIVIKINCRSDAEDIQEPIPYGLAVTLEIAEGVDIPIYQEVRERLAIQVPVRNVSSN